MFSIVIKLIAMLFPVALGYFLKQVGFFGKTDYKILAKIAINITLPCTVIASFAKLELDRSLISISVLAFVLNIAVLIYAVITSAGIKNRKLRCMDMFSVVGFNMGNFLIPFAQQFMGSAGVAVTALFDAGNSPMCTGGHYIAITTIVGEEGKKTTIKDVFRKLLASPPLLVYILMIIMTAAKLRIPEPVAEVCSLTGNANAFVSMFMMGLMFEIHFEKAYMQEAAFVLIRKYAFSVVVALICFYLLPFELRVRQVLVLIAFAPIPSLAAIFTENVEGDVGLCSFITSCSFILSSIFITALIFIMNVA